MPYTSDFLVKQAGLAGCNGHVPYDVEICRQVRNHVEVPFHLQKRDNLLFTRSDPVVPLYRTIYHRGLLVRYLYRPSELLIRLLW